MAAKKTLILNKEIDQSTKPKSVKNEDGNGGINNIKKEMQRSESINSKGKKLPVPPQKLPSQNSISPIQENKSKKKDPSVQRLNVVKEILSTEEGYIQRLTMIDQHFRCHFLKHADSHEKSYPSVKQIEDMFSNLSSILKFHIDFFLPLLKERVEKWNNESRVGDIFVTYGPHFKLYTIYINNYESACSAIMAAAKRYPKFEKDLEERQKAPECNHLRLTHHMLDPIQRIPRYKLLLTEYLKYASDNPVEVEAVNSALDIVSASAQKANDRIRETQNAMKLLEIQQMLVESDDIVAAGRRFVKEGDISRRTSRNTKLQVCHLFLFSDIILCCSKVSNTKYKKKVKLEISEVTIQEDISVEKKEFSFSLVAPNQTLELVVQSQEELTEWLDNIKETVRLYEDKLRSFMLKSRSHSDCLGMQQASINANGKIKIMIHSNKSKPWVEIYAKLSADLVLSIFGNCEDSNPDYVINLKNFNIEKTKEQGTDTLLLSDKILEFTIYSKEDNTVVQKWYQLLKSQE